MPLLLYLPVQLHDLPRDMENFCWWWAVHWSTMASPSVNPLTEMSSAEVTDLVEHLTDYALRKMRKLSWRGIRLMNSPAAALRHFSGPGGVSPTDVAASAIESFLDGTREWNRTRAPDFRQFLRGVVDSMVSHLVTSIENRATSEALVAAAAKAGASHLESRLPAVGSDARTPLDLCVDNEWRDRFQTAIFKEVEGDPLLGDLLQCLGAGMPPAETAEMLEIPVIDVYNAQRRLSTKIDKVCSKLARSAKP